MNFKPRNIYLLRHAEPLMAPGGKRFLGWSDPPLSPEGIRQAEGWKPFFSAVELTAVFCSDLQRSRQTAECIMAGGALQITAMPELRELNMGAWDGQTFEAVRRRDPEGYTARGLDPAHFRPPGGESFDDLLQRAAAAFDHILAATSGPLLIIGHAGVNRTLLCRLLQMPLKHLFRIAQDYAALNIITDSQNRFRIQTLNCRANQPIIDGQ